MSDFSRRVFDTSERRDTPVLTSYFKPKLPAVAQSQREYRTGDHEGRMFVVEPLNVASNVLQALKILSAFLGSAFLVVRQFEIPPY